MEWPRNYVLMQAMINLAPLILATLAYLVQKRKHLSQLAQPAQNTEIAQNSVVTKGEFLWQIPIVFEVRNFILWKRLKDAIKENQKRMSCESRDAVMIVYSQIETLRMYQTFGTSIPSFILQFAVVMKEKKVFKWNEFGKSRLHTDDDYILGRLAAASLLFSCLINIIMISENFIYMPIYDKSDMTKKKTTSQTKKAHLFIVPIIAVIFLPRIINLGLFFGSWRGQEGLAGLFIFIGALIIYTIGFAILIWKKYKKEWKENSYPLILSYLTSFFCPCIIMHPESKLVFFASLVSTIPHLILTSAMLIVANHYPDPRLASDDFGFLLPCFLIAPTFTWMLSAYSREESQKILLNAINLRVVRFFLFTIVLSALDDVTDVLTAKNYLR